MKAKIIVFFLVFFLTVFVVNRAHSPAPAVEKIRTPGEIATEMQNSCLANKGICYNRSFYDLARKGGYELSYQTLLALQKKDPSALQCHLFAHTIGKGVYDHDPKNWKNILARATSACSYGVGHGLITMHNFNLPQALSDCDLLTSLSRNSCYLGVFMEYSFSRAPKRISLKNPWTFCTDLPVRYKASCANYLPHTLLAQNYDLDLPRLGILCMNTSDQALWRPCISYVGALAAVTSLGEKSAILKECNQIRVQEGRIECIQSAAMRVTYEKYANWPENSKNLCNELPENFVNGCIDKINKYSN